MAMALLDALKAQAGGWTSVSRFIQESGMGE